MGFLKLLLGPLGILMDGFGEQTSEEDAKNKPRAPIGTPKVRILISLAITIVFGIIYYYFKLPALNISNTFKKCFCCLTNSGNLPNRKQKIRHFAGAEGEGAGTTAEIVANVQKYP